MDETKESALASWRKLQQQLRENGDSARLSNVAKIELDVVANQLFEQAYLSRWE